MAKIIPLTKGYETIIDDDDFERVSHHSWSINLKYNYCRAMSTIKRKRIYLHRFILNLTDPCITVDHINGNPLDNRKENLRLCTQRNNSKNQKKRKNNQSNYKGVSWKKDTKKWRARIMLNYKEIWLGSFSSKEEAAQAYNDAAIKYFGEFANLNEINK